MEIEFELPGFSSRAVLKNIARDLHAAGLTVDGDVHPYHASSRAGYHSGEKGGRGLWRLELDRSVSGELVSPILYDEPATWMNILLACEIIRGWGGSATVNTGGHVHVSTRDYDHHLANYVSVAEYIKHHGDTLYRLGHNPAMESHRGQAFCQFESLPARGYTSIGAVRQNHLHRSAVNMGGMTEDTKGHIEFRMWDGSLDPAVIQAQVKVSLAVVEAAFRTAALDLPPNAGVREEPGTHAGLRSLGSAPDLTEAGSLSFRMLMDEIFWRAADKEQLAALFAATRWPERWEPPPPPGGPGMNVIVRNVPAARQPPAAPRHADGRPYLYEMIHAAGALRGYADEPAELVAMLIPGYGELGDDSGRAVARIRLALDVQVRLQAELAAGRLGECGPEERAVLLGGRHEPPALAEWTAPVPLVLVTSFYLPEGTLPRPSGPEELQIWLDPADDWTLLTSLHAAGVITVGGRARRPDQGRGQR
ncbi:hypothetical protein GCM10020001_001930 [Nonomuraea salmonea]